MLTSLYLWSYKSSRNLPYVVFLHIVGSFPGPVSTLPIHSLRRHTNIGLGEKMSSIQGPNHVQKNTCSLYIYKTLHYPIIVHLEMGIVLSPMRSCKPHALVDLENFGTPIGTQGLNSLTSQVSLVSTLSRSQIQMAIPALLDHVKR